MPYLPEHDTLTDRDTLLEFVGAHPLASLVTHDGQRPDLDLVPLLPVQTEAGLELVGHVARANPLWQPGRQQGPVLATFGPVDHYVSPTWYPSKAEHHRTVPTWNYLVVHARGRLVVHDDPTWTRGVVARLTQRMEADQPQPWRTGQAPADYLTQMLANIVGIAVEVDSLVGKFKVSAARSTANREGALAGIRAAGGPAELVEAMAPSSPAP